MQGKIIETYYKDIYDIVHKAYSTGARDLRINIEFKLSFGDWAMISQITVVFKN